MQQLQLNVHLQRRDPSHHALGGSVNTIDSEGMIGQPSPSVLATKMYEERVKHLHSADSETSSALIDANRMALYKTQANNQGQLLQGSPGNMSAAFQQIQSLTPLTTDIKSEVNLGGNQKSLSMDPSSIYGQVILQPKSGLGGAVLNQGVSGLPLRGWPLTGIDQLRPNLGKQMQNPNLQTQNQFLLTSQQQHVLAQAQMQGNFGNSTNFGEMSRGNMNTKVSPSVRNDGSICFPVQSSSPKSHLHLSLSHPSPTKSVPISGEIRLSPSLRATLTIRNGKSTKSTNEGRYTRHITRPSWLSWVFLELEKLNLHVEDLTRLLNKKDGFTRMDDVDVVRVCLLILLHTGFLGREARQPIPNDLIKLVEDLNAWNLFPWGSYLWKATWNKLSSALDDRKSLHGDGSKYTLTGFIWAFKIWIFEVFPAMKTYAIKTSNDIPRAISWKRKRTLQWEDLLRYTTINNEANTPLQRLTPTEAELATDWWQASKRFFDGTVDEKPPLRDPSPRPELSPHPEPSSDRPDYTPPQRQPSPILSHHRASSPPSPQDSGPIRWMLYVGFSLHDGVHALDGVDVLLRLRSPQWCEDSARRSPTHLSSLKSPLQSFKRPLSSLKSPPIVQEATVIVEEVPPTIPEPDSHGVIYRSIEKPPPVPDMMDESWLSYELPASTLPVSEVERRQLPEIIVDNTLWAKTAVDFYLHERSQGCYTDISKLNDEMFLLLDRSWWGVLLGVEDSGYFDGEVFIPVLERRHWLLVQLQLPSLKIIVYDSMINYISLSDLRDIIKGWSSHLAKFLDGINYWTHSGHKKPKKFNVTVVGDETVPQQSPGGRGDCGPLVCMCLARLTTRSTEFLPPTDRDRAARNGKVYLLTDNEDVERFITYISVSSDDVTLYVVEPRSSIVGSVAGSNQLSFSQNPQPFSNPNPNQLSAPNSGFRIDQLDDDELTEKIVSTSQYSKFDLSQYPDFDIGQYSDFDDVSEEETDPVCNDFDIGQYPNFDDETTVAEEDVVDDNEEEVEAVNEHVEHPFCNSYNPEEEKKEEKEEEKVPEEKKMPREYNWNMPELLQIPEEELVKKAVDCYTKVIRIKKDDCFDTKEDLKIALYTKCVEDQLKVNKSRKDRFETRVYWGHEIMTDMNARFKISISYSQAWRAKCYALELLRGSPEVSFAQLPAYCHNLKLKNPRSVTHIKTDRDGRFELLFIAISDAIRSFITCMHPVIIVDGAHLKDRYLGVNLLAVAMDANNGILPIAYGVGKSETSGSWTWFMGHLRDCIGPISNLTIISDRANSIDNAVRRCFPDAFHGLCGVHLYLKSKIKCAQTLEDVGFERWSRVHQLGARYGFMTSNSAESINALSRHSRKLPITMLMEFFRASIQQWYYKKRNHAGTLEHRVTPWTEKKITKRVVKSTSWRVEPCSNTFASRCIDCTEKIGFDLCGDCYATRPKLPGRFNQRHTSEHRFEVLQSSDSNVLP
ncbi:transcriptional corepressor LEUNIG-like isoform X7 [Hibiscus syriacus]|uniref:Transcriptional corepressor LEUNIG-like isoform X7 n=1 Tax=Hibiscus syriacus TaxID=106335 RepID=A0A6A2Z1C5_HIBSY|nr:transcriptional corepressor LEUNIG-like isoform X7 [Hibiscus syriacus]